MPEMMRFSMLLDKDGVTHIIKVKTCISVFSESRPMSCADPFELPLISVGK